MKSLQVIFSLILIWFIVNATIVSSYDSKIDENLKLLICAHENNKQDSVKYYAKKYNSTLDKQYLFKQFATFYLVKRPVSKKGNDFFDDYKNIKCQ